MKTIFCFIILISQSLYASSVDLDTIWSACSHPGNNWTYCQNLSEFQKDQERRLESVINRYTFNWQRNLVTIIYYGISKKIPIEHKIQKDMYLNFFLKENETSISFVYEF